MLLKEAELTQLMKIAWRGCWGGGGGGGGGGRERKGGGRQDLGDGPSLGRGSSRGARKDDKRGGLEAGEGGVGPASEWRGARRGGKGQLGRP